MAKIEVNYYPPGKVAAEFMNSNAFVSGIRGPIGSGKTTACLTRLLKFAAIQKPYNGIRYSRYAVIRNTYPELKTTTIKSWFGLVPQDSGRWQGEGPPTHHIKTSTLDMEVLFIALDRPDHVKKLLSLELSRAYINEAREVPKIIMDGLTGRVGRYPKIEWGGCSNSGIDMDTNSPDTDHWWYIFSERDDSTTKGKEWLDNLDETERELRQLGLLPKGQKFFQFFSQPGGREPNAENIPNLEPGYYVKACAGKSKEWIDVYVNNQYGFVMDGKPVYPEYKDSTHCREVSVIPGLPIIRAWDFGLTPACLFGQQLANGRVIFIYELTSEDMGIDRFSDLVLNQSELLYPGYTFSDVGDPAGNTRGQTDERTCFDIMRAKGINIQGGQQNVTIRIESVKKLLNMLIDGEPGLLISPKCKILRKGFQGGYHYKRLNVSGSDRYTDEPNKNFTSHSHDCAQYFCSSLFSGSLQQKQKVTINYRELYG